MKNNNKGFTLVELIVVMAILGIVATLTALSVAASNSARAEQCATSVNSLISMCRSRSLSRAGDVQLTISLDGNGNIVGEYFKNGDGVPVSTDTFPGRGITVLCTTIVSNSPTTNALTTENPLTLSFDRSTGAQKNSPTCTAISFTSTRTYTITLVPSTGYHHLA